MRRSSRVPDWLDLAIGALLLCLAASVRLRVLAVAEVGTDSIVPFLTAFEMMTSGDWLSPGYRPEAGPGQAWSYVPFLLGVDGLEEAFRRRVLVQALWVPTLYMAFRIALARFWGLRPGSSQGGSARWSERLAPLAGACAFGFAQGPLLTLQSGTHCSVAIGWAALISVAVLLWVVAGDRRWLLVAWGALPFAVMSHGMAAGYAVALLLVSVPEWRAGRRGIVAGGVALCAIGYLPHGLVLGRQALAGGFGSVVRMATYNSADSEHLWAHMAERTIHQFTVVDPLPWGPALALAPPTALIVVTVAARLAPGLFLPDQQRRLWWFLGWLGCAVFGTALVGSLIGYMEAYHWRVLYPAAAAALAITVDVVRHSVLSRRRARPVGAPVCRELAAASAAVLLVVGSAWGAHKRWPARSMESSNLRTISRFAAVIAADSAGARRWYDRGGVSGVVWGTTQALYLQERLLGTEGSLGTDGSLYLIFAAEDVLAEEIERAAGWSGRGVPLAGRSGGTLVARAKPFMGPSVLLIRFDRPAGTTRPRHRGEVQGGSPTPRTGFSRVDSRPAEPRSVPIAARIYALNDRHRSA